MHNWSFGAWARLALAALIMVAPGGCKAKVDRSGADGGPGTGATGADLQQVDRIVTSHLTNTSSQTSLPGGEALIAVDRVHRLGLTHKTPNSATASGKARVFVRTTSGEDIRRTMPLSCQLVRKSGRWAVRSCKIGGSQVAARVMGPSGNDAVGGEWTVGVPECDRLMRFIRCYSSKMPAASQAAMKNAYGKMLQSYRKMAQNPATRATLVKSCTMAIKAMHKGIGKLPKFTDCRQDL